jgi:hypothetical protein
VFSTLSRAVLCCAASSTLNGEKKTSLPGVHLIIIIGFKVLCAGEIKVAEALCTAAPHKIRIQKVRRVSFIRIWLCCLAFPTTGGGCCIYKLIIEASLSGFRAFYEPERGDASPRGRSRAWSDSSCGCWATQAGQDARTRYLATPVVAADVGTRGHPAGWDER